MDELYELKEALCEELKEYGKKDLTAGSLDVVDKLAHTIKNLDKIIEEYEGGYSGTDYNMYDGSYARGRGSNASRDSRGRYSSRGYSRRGYSRDGGMVEDLRSLMDGAPTDIRQDIQRVIDKIENR